MPHVLVVDDNLSFAQNIAEVFAMEGFGADIAESAEAALAHLRARDVAVLVTDYRLPGMNGLELIRRLRHERPDVRCCLVSAYGDDQTIASTIAAGAAFLPKPVDLSRLIQVITQPS